MSGGSSGEDLKGMINPGDGKPGIPDDDRDICMGDEVFQIGVCL